MRIMKGLFILAVIFSMYIPAYAYETDILPYEGEQHTVITQEETPKSDAANDAEQEHMTQNVAAPGNDSTAAPETWKNAELPILTTGGEVVEPWEDDESNPGNDGSVPVGETDIQQEESLQRDIESNVSSTESAQSDGKSAKSDEENIQANELTQQTKPLHKAVWIIVGVAIVVAAAAAAVILKKKK